MPPLRVAVYAHVGSLPRQVPAVADTAYLLLRSMSAYIPLSLTTVTVCSLPMRSGFSYLCKYITKKL